MSQKRTPSDREHIELIEELHRRQGVMYAGGAIEPVTELLAPDIVWHVPGSSPIAGDHCGHEGVISYFKLRRALAQSSMRMHPRELLADGEALVWLVDGSARLDGQDVNWRTVGVYRIDRGRVREIWLVPLDLALFDRLWSAKAST
ncbi:MAG: nuclear transport factor 2 family protein [Solirubrobacteraceae bacterium]